VVVMMMMMIRWDRKIFLHGNHGCGFEIPKYPDYSVVVWARRMVVCWLAKFWILMMMMDEQRNGRPKKVSSRGWYWTVTTFWKKKNRRRMTWSRATTDRVPDNREKHPPSGGTQIRLSEEHPDRMHVEVLVSWQWWIGRSAEQWWTMPLQDL
jgi:hypothetical protein